MLPIAVDAMGGDNAPKREVEGAIRAAHELGIGVILVGQKDVLRAELTLHPRAKGLPIEIHHASEFITMDDSAAKAVRTKKDSSIRVACRLVRDDVAQGVVSAGNTGAVMATSKIVQGVIRGVTRPALAGAFPSLTGSPVVLLDVGANVDCKPEMLAQFAVMGEIYSRLVLGVERPRVALLSIGEEPNKGNELTREAHRLLKGAPVGFIGNIEGREIYSGDADVVVCDGFTGNIVLKTSEGLVEVVDAILGEALRDAPASREPFEQFRRRMDYSEYGGALLLGVAGLVIVGHGRSSPTAVQNAIRMAARYASDDFVSRVEREIAAATVS